MSAITFTNLTKSFGKLVAVNDVTFSVKEGQIFGFLGPNGAGKTTAIRCMMDFIRANSGKVTVFGKDSQIDTVEIKSIIGYLPADHHYYENWNGRDHIKFVSKLRGINEYPDELIKKLDFNPKVKVRTLSSGNKQKLGIILAMLGKPKILVLDEPTQGLDPLLQNSFYELIHEYKQSGGTVFMSSHNLPEVERICDSVAIIRQGKLAAEETLESLREKSLHKFSLLFSEPVERSLFNIKDVKIVTFSPSSVVLEAKGEPTELLAVIAKLPIKDIEVSHASLEEIFMEVYR